MKKGIIILIGVIAIFLIASCKKDSNSSSPAGLLKSWSLIQYASDSLSHTFIYDSKRRLAMDIVKRGSWSDTSSYTYYSDSISDSDSYSTGSGKGTIYLNSQGYRVRDSGGSSWSYDGNGYINSSTSPYGSSFYTYNSNNQLASETDIYTSGSSSSTYTSTFSYQNDDPVTDPYYTAPFLWLNGKGTGALCWMYTQIGGGDTTTYYCTNIVDSQNRLTQRTQTTSNPSATPTITNYTYY